MEFTKFKRSKKLTRNLTDEEIQTEISELEQTDFLPLYNKDIPYANYGYIHTFRVISDGLRQSWIKQLMGGLLAGIWIGVCYTAVAYTTAYINNPSVVKLLTGLVFAGDILMISFLGGGFATAHMWYNRTMFKRVEKWSIFLKAWFWVYIGNIVGIGLFVSLLYVSNGFGDGQVLLKTYDNFGLHKIFEVGHQLGAGQDYTSSHIGKTMGWVFGSSILCNFLICLATQGAKSTKGNTVASMIMYLFILLFFAIGGYQHSVANWFGAWLLIVMALDNGAATEAINAAQMVLNKDTGEMELIKGAIMFSKDASWLFILLNILPAIAGNFLGALIIGTFMGLYNKDYDTLLLKEARLKFLHEIVEDRAHPHLKKHRLHIKRTNKTVSETVKSEK
ncbi:formate/nitrite transporter family protein [[Acholeplasma] multilocale]|uniref:formate/nitrite transporter family protein n=1 Tax=[Acholeplasma] multilocale TaxID=264638 RepID=UPI00047EA8D9|nr:formate/nitrite transporter family protein [[Acholeplasma] multilocale]